MTDPHPVPVASDWPTIRAELHAAAAHCLWQDLDGLHLEAPPPTPPATSILWAWASTALWRLRLDSAIVYGARIDVTALAGADRRPVQSWAPGDGRIAAFRAATPGLTLTDLRFEHIVIDGITHAAGPVTFLRPVPGNGTSTDGLPR